jgi:hypothetical protein
MQKTTNRRSVRHRCLRYIEIFTPYKVPVKLASMRVLNP